MNLEILSPFPDIHPVFNYDGRLWETKQAFSFKYKDHGYTIPKGFQFDGASIPRAVWWYASPMDKDLLLGALVHDFCYNPKTRPKGISKLEADKMLRILCIRSGMRKSKAWVIYSSVASFGWFAWRRK